MGTKIVLNNKINTRQFIAGERSEAKPSRKTLKNFYCCSCLSPKHSDRENIESRTPYLAIVFLLLRCHGSQFYEPILLLNGSFLLLCNFLLRSLRFAVLACVNEPASATSRKVPTTSMMGNLMCFHARMAIEAC